MAKLKVIELFAGIGAQREALKRAGIEHEVVAISEIDKYALMAYELLHGKTPNLGDISKIDKLPKSDMWTYSFPCTDISVAGRLGGFEKGSNTHSSLLWEVQRLLDKSNDDGELPKYLIMENVKNLISKKFMPLFQVWLDYLSSLGYKNFYQVMNAKNYGVPQNRERVFMISIRDTNATYSFPDKITSTIKLKDLLEDEVSEKYYLSEKMIKCLTDTTNRNGWIRAKQFRPHNPNESTTAFTVTTKAGRSRSCDNFIEVFDFRYDEGARGRVEQDLSPTITTKVGNGGLSGQPLLKIPEATKVGYAVAHIGDGVYTNRTHSKRGVVQRNAIPTLKTSPHDLGVVVNDPNEMISIRRLTPRECWRLMGWEDSRIDVITGIKELSNTQLYKMAGNSIVVNVLEEIFKKEMKSREKNKQVVQKDTMYKGMELDKEYTLEELGL